MQNDQTSFRWTVSDAGIRSSDRAPLVSVSLQTRTASYPSGTYAGKCEALAPEPPTELSAILCWRGGSGVEIGIFQNGDTKQVRTIARTGSIPPGSRDNFQTEVLFDLNSNE